jgi:hypothetical protein
MKGTESRRETRLPIESIILPFFGSRESDFQPFEYLLQDVSQGGVKISIPHWVQGRESINRGERINLHVPFEVKGKVLYSGLVAWQATDEDGQGQFLGVMMDQGKPMNYPVYFSVDSRQVSIDFGAFETRTPLLARLAKDIYLLKRGCLIYLKHLSAIFSRLADLPKEEYEYFSEFVFEDIVRRTQNNKDYFKNLYGKIVSSGNSFKETCAAIDLSELRQAIEPEMYIEIFKVIYNKTSGMQYLYAIKQLEGKLYVSYNTLIMAYCSSL